MGLNLKIMFVMVVMTRRFCVLILAILLLSLFEVLIIVVLFTTLVNLALSICYKILCLMIVGMHKMHIREIDLENRVQNYFFDNLMKAKKIETKNISIDEKNYKDLLINFTRYVQSKSIKMLSLH